MAELSDVEENSRPVAYWAVGIGIFCVAGLAGTIAYMRYRWCFATPDGIAAAASTAGAAFSAFAFVGVIATILLQARELRLQRAALLDTRKEFTEQNATMARDVFERGFFQLLELNRNAYREQRASIVGKTQTGSAAFDAVINHRLRSVVEKLHAPPAIGLAEFGKWYEQELLVEGSDFGRYFRTLYHLLSFIADQHQKLTDEQRRHYARIVRTQLTDPEVALLIANCHSDPGADMLPLARTFRLAKVARLPKAMADRPDVFGEWLAQREEV